MALRQQLFRVSRTEQIYRISLNRNSQVKVGCVATGNSHCLRLEVVLRRTRAVNPSRIVFDRFAIDSVRREATLNDLIIKLTALEFNILYFLASHPRQSWSRRQLIEKIWGWDCNDTGEEQLVSVHIAQIRKKMIQVDAIGSQFIKTIHGYGYRFEPP
ncbi:MAG: response regulator transcription factor [Microcoleus sp. SU_5_3]|nr:response regulator transcription factor [Microcoleus sp. SU_5_3]